MVDQIYDTDVNKEYIINGNSAILKCQMPSFIADFLTVISWNTDHDDHYSISDSTNYGNYSTQKRLILIQSLLYNVRLSCSRSEALIYSNQNIWYNLDFLSGEGGIFGISAVCE